MNVRFVKLSETSEANKLQSEPSKDSELAVTLTGTLDSLHTFSDHVSRPAFTHACLSCPTFSAGHTCHNSSPSSHQRANLLFSSFLGKSSETTSMSYFATHVTWCQLHFDSTTAAFIPTHWYHQTRVNIDVYWKLLLTISWFLQSNIICFQSWLQLIGILLHSIFFFSVPRVCVSVCVCDLQTCLHGLSPVTTL